jgi:hypothetical protein
MLPQVGNERLHNQQDQRAFDKVVAALKAVLEFLRLFREPTKWAALPLAKGWVIGASAYGPPQMSLTMDYHVELRGNVAPSTGVTTTIAQLPANMRPPRNLLLVSYSGGTPVGLLISSTGLITALGGTGSPYSLDNIRFDTRVV